MLCIWTWRLYVTLAGNHHGDAGPVTWSPLSLFTGLAVLLHMCRKLYNLPQVISLKQQWNINIRDFAGVTHWSFWLLRYEFPLPVSLCRATPGFDPLSGVVPECTWPTSKQATHDDPRVSPDTREFCFLKVSVFSACSNFVSLCFGVQFLSRLLDRANRYLLYSAVSSSSLWAVFRGHVTLLLLKTNYTFIVKNL